MLNSKEFVRELQLRHESAWMNPNLESADAALAALPLTRTDVDDAEARLERFAPFIKKVFPETAADRGLIESPLTEIENMRAWLNENEGAQLAGKLFLKRDSDLPVAGSVKARGGCYAVLKHTEDLALANRLVEMRDDYSVFATRAFRNFFSQYELHVGSTGNLGLSIGIMGAALGYRVTVHMSADARQWKKDLLRAKGVTVLEYGADYSYAVQKGRERATEDTKSYFIDDENSVDLFLGYAVAARRLKAQLAEQNIAVDDEHPLLVYIPCGVGGAPGGICFGLKQEFGDAAHVYFTEPVEAPCMLLGLASGLQNEICVQDIGLTGRTAADGLAVSRPSGFVGETVKAIVSGGFTVSDERLFADLHALYETEGLFVEPSACAGFAGVGIGRQAGGGGGRVNTQTVFSVPLVAPAEGVDRIGPGEGEIGDAVIIENGILFFLVIDLCAVNADLVGCRCDGDAAALRLASLGNIGALRAAGGDIERLGGIVPVGLHAHETA